MIDFACFAFVLAVLIVCTFGNDDRFHYQAGLRACLDLGKMREREWKFLRIEAFLIRYKGSAMAG